MDKDKRRILALVNAIKQATGCGYVAACSLAEIVYEAGLAMAKDEAKPKPADPNPMETFANVSSKFLEDWAQGRRTAEETCETLATAAQARGLLAKPQPQEKADGPEKKETSPR